MVGAPQALLPYIHERGEMMDKRLRDVIDAIDYYELLRMKKDLESGGHHLKQFLGEEIKKRQMMHQVLCSVCGTDIDPYSTSTSTLMFGPDDFKKKATFCGKDCLEYFIKNMEGMKKASSPKTQIDSSQV